MNRPNSTPLPDTSFLWHLGDPAAPVLVGEHNLAMAVGARGAASTIENAMSAAAQYWLTPNGALAAHIDGSLLL